MAKDSIVKNARNHLLSLLPKNSVGAEIGAWKGDFTTDILSQVNPEKLYIIDPYKHFGEYENAWYGGGIGEQEKMDLIFEGFKGRFASEIENNQIQIHRNVSKEGLSKIEDESLDFTYIDGNHTYEFVLEDLELSFAKVKKGGFITGDDYNLVGWWDDGVTKAVEHFLAKYESKVKLIYVLETQFAFIKL